MNIPDPLGVSLVAALHQRKELQSGGISMVTNLARAFSEKVVEQTVFFKPTSLFSSIDKFPNAFAQSSRSSPSASSSIGIVLW